MLRRRDFLTLLLSAGFAARLDCQLGVPRREALFAPLGVTQYEWIGPPRWDHHMPCAASGVRMRARDLARFGSVFLHRGAWAGRRIVPEAWVDRSTQRHVQRTQIEAAWVTDTNGGLAPWMGMTSSLPAVMATSASLSCRKSASLLPSSRVSTTSLEDMANVSLQP